MKGKPTSSSWLSFTSQREDVGGSKEIVRTVHKKEFTIYTSVYGSARHNLTHLQLINISFTLIFMWWTILRRFFKHLLLLLCGKFLLFGFFAHKWTVGESFLALCARLDNKLHKPKNLRCAVFVSDWKIASCSLATPHRQKFFFSCRRSMRWKTSNQILLKVQKAFNNGKFSSLDLILFLERTGAKHRKEESMWNRCVHDKNLFNLR